MRRRPHPSHIPTLFLMLLARAGVTADRRRRLPGGVE